MLVPGCSHLLDSNFPGTTTVLIYTDMETDKNFKVVGGLMCSGGAIVSALSRAFLTTGKDLVSGVGLGVGAVGLIVLIIAWRQGQQ